MVVELNIHHLFKYPVDTVLKTYLEKHKNSKDNAEKVEFISSSNKDYMDCSKRKITMANYFPQFFRKINILKRDTVTIEEEIWSQESERRHWIRQNDTTWDDAVIAHLIYLSEEEKNPKWSLWQQDTVIDLNSFGFLGVALELYLKRHIQTKVKSDFDTMEKIMDKKDIFMK